MPPLPTGLAFVLQFLDESKRQLSFKTDARRAGGQKLREDPFAFDFILADGVCSNFFSGLCGIARISQKNKLIGGNQQHAVTAGETAQVANIFRLAEEQGVKLKLRQKIGGLLPAMNMDHGSETLRGKAGSKSAQGQVVTHGAETGDLADDHAGNVGMLAKGFPGMDIGQVGFNHGEADAGNRVTQ